jgi:hypothetical protein
MVGDKACPNVTCQSKNKLTKVFNSDSYSDVNGITYHYVRSLKFPNLEFQTLASTGSARARNGRVDYESQMNVLMYV